MSINYSFTCNLVPGVILVKSSDSVFIQILVLSDLLLILIYCRTSNNVLEHYEDDGEYGAGRRVFQLLRHNDITGKKCVRQPLVWWSGPGRGKIWPHQGGCTKDFRLTVDRKYSTKRESTKSSSMTTTTSATTAS